MLTKFNILDLLSVVRNKCDVARTGIFCFEWNLCKYLWYLWFLNPALKQEVMQWRDETRKPTKRGSFSHICKAAWNHREIETANVRSFFLLSIFFVSSSDVDVVRRANWRVNVFLYSVWPYNANQNIGFYSCYYATITI